MFAKHKWIYLFLLLLLLAVAGYLRLTSIDWDEGQQLHPDERFLIDVETRIAPAKSWAEYFDTANSPLNPNNHGLTFFVYGTLPIFMVRYAFEWLGQMDMSFPVQLVGRAFSALADLGVVLLVYLIASRLFDRRIALLAAAFSTFTVMQVQQSHFFTVDNFTNFFTYLALFFALRIASKKIPVASLEGEAPSPHLSFPDFALFGIALGMAVASKASAAPLAMVLPAGLAIFLWRMPRDQREALYGSGVAYMLLAAAMSLLAFRIFQPYAFAGPSFFNLRLNPHWVDTMRQLSAQVTGDVDWPPSMQWARRPIWFALQHLTLWGLGVPLALAAWSGFIWMAWRLYRNDWRKPEIVLWGWAVVYLGWQSMAFNPTMRYLLPAYPALAIFGAWALLRLWDEGALSRDDGSLWRYWARPVSVALIGLTVLGSALWAFAFVRIYQTPITRIAATRWIYQNLPGPLTLSVRDGEEEFNQPLPFPRDFLVTAQTPYFTAISPKGGGQLEEVGLHHLLAPILLELRSGEGEAATLLTQKTEIFDLLGLTPGEAGELLLPLPGGLQGTYLLALYLPAGEGQVRLEQVEAYNSQFPEQEPLLLLAQPQELELGQENLLDFALDQSLVVDHLRVRFTVLGPLELAPQNLVLKVSVTPGMDTIVAEVRRTIVPTTNKGALESASAFVLEPAVNLEEGQELYLQLEMESEGVITLLGSAVINESSWDDGLPRRIDGYDGFAGIYQGDLNLEMYWDEDLSKLERFLNFLERGEYIFISSSRQWASLPRIPERFPLVSEYYRLLLGCPAERSVESCYNSAQVDSFEGLLGFDLVQVFESPPRIDSLVIHDQASEEAFTVYDHPKVFIFKKRADYDHEAVTALLSAVDLEHVQHITPKQASGRVAPTLMLPEFRWDTQRARGTWSELFNSDAWGNTSPWISALVWYLALAVLGLAAFPLLRMALPGLGDGGYPFARLAGLLLLSYFAWLGASLGLTFSRTWLGLVAVTIILAGFVLAYPKRAELRTFWNSKRAYLLRVELLFLAFFVFMLLLRLGNADLWHPGKGGEKPMDFSYFNAVLKSTSFPPYDPWFSGGYINYYYYGFVLVGSLTKLLGILPSVAYNLILPTLFAMLALGAYSLTWNLFDAWKRRSNEDEVPIPSAFAALSAALAVNLLGNLGSLQMIFQGYQRLGAEGALNGEVGIFTRMFWFARGLIINLRGDALPFGLGDWYWNPTRIIPAPGETIPITEFPLFTFTYADLHAHMIALPLTLLALAWALSAIQSRAWEGQRTPLQLGWSFALAAIAIGSLRPTNTWDFPTYLLIGALATAYAIWRYAPRTRSKDGGLSSPWLYIIGGPVLLAFLSLLAYQPYAEWYRQGFTSMQLWRGTHTPSGAYLVHWGIFFFFIVAWMIWETRQWLAATPLSSLRKLEPYRPFIYAGFLLVLAVLLALVALEVHIAWLVWPLMLWTGLLILGPKLPVEKRLVLFLVGTGLFLTLMVEVIVLRGDIFRMNTVFKFYIQVWVLFGLSAALALAWTLSEINQWLSAWRRTWRLAAIALLVSAGLFLLLGVPAKIQDRMVADAPRTLDGMRYMQHAVYYDKDQALDLNQDYETIRWLQENVKGSPVIVEAHTGEYKWGSRISIYTGLPSVVGWNWHQRQQREFVPGNDVWARVYAVEDFYLSSDLTQVKDFLRSYEVKYIVVGQLERAYYPGPGLEKFESQDGILWREVFRFEDTVVYEVLDVALASQ